MTQTDFWSRRRAAVQAEAEADTTAVQAAELAQAEAELEALSDEELLQREGLCEPESLESAEDVQTFLKAALPQRLKTRALRQLWRLNPVLANLDGLLEYGEDYTDAATVVENLQSAYEVGKGMLGRFESLVAEEAPDVTQEDDEPTLAQDDPIPAPAHAAAEPVLPDRQVIEAAEAPEFEPDMLPPSSRRMQFAFDT